MREIKFRAWDRVAKRWIGKLSFEHLCVCGDVVVLVIYGADRRGGYSPTSIRQLTHPKVDALDIVQYTGLKDKNGKEIWEEDILRKDVAVLEKDRPIYRNYVVEFNDGAFKYGHGRIIDGYTEVIGNIYENPELLEPPNA